jgi:hypothetical protein
MRLVVLALTVASVGCGATLRRDPRPDPIASAPCVPRTGASAPTYSELFASYFAAGTPGHCAAAHCHGTVGTNVWLCGDSADSCYRGMVRVGLIDAKNPTHSAIADAARSPLSWVSSSGDMPADAAGSMPEARDAIGAWVAACAPND